jgi:hypothetical protein
VGEFGCVLGMDDGGLTCEGCRRKGISTKTEKEELWGCTEHVEGMFGSIAVLPVHRGSELEEGLVRCPILECENVTVAFRLCGKEGKS